MLKICPCTLYLRGDDMKKIVTLIVTAALLFACAGCSETAPIEVSRPDWATDPTPTPKASSNEPVKIGETFSVAGRRVGSWDDGDGPPEPGKLEVTVLGYKVYDHYSDTGIPKEEFSCGTEFDIEETPLVMVEMKIKKVSGVKKDTGRESRELITKFQLFSKEQLQWCEENEMQPMGEMCDYFSGHGDWEADYKGYHYYWLDIGEEKTYQLGFFLKDPNGPWGGKDWFNSVDGGLMMGVDTGGMGQTSLYVDLET